MTARALIANASFGPDEVKILTQAFDEAWGQIAPAVDFEPETIEAARFNLATAVLELAALSHGSPLDANKLRDQAVERMHSNLTTLQ
jgi:hypothetical protein